MKIMKSKVMTMVMQLIGSGFSICVEKVWLTSGYCSTTYISLYTLS